ncbi:CPBP family intramembrane metalloprotease [Gammaproteobacteria bacterium]|nr:CPBP family intramembrane metalloprotease [Gammaproteobacteria bacterium]
MTVNSESSEILQESVNSKRQRAVVELLAFVVFALVSNEVMDPFFGSYSGPASLITTLIILTIYIHRRGQNWRSMGLCKLPGLKAKLLVVPQAMAIFVTVLLSIVLLTKGLEAIGLTFMSEPIDGEVERWGDLQGNLPMYLILIALSWVSAGFGEEMFFRGFLITRLQTAFNSIKFSSAISVLLAALLFGYVHYYYQGVAGLVNAGVIGVIFGMYFLLYKRNLWPLVVAHGCINSLGFTSEFMGWGL